MKVIRKGPPQSLPVEIDCLNCESLLEVSKEDAHRKDSDRDGAALVFRCPVCSSDVWISLSVWKS